MGVYVGIRENAEPEIFKSETTPTKETHPQYDFVYMDRLKQLKMYGDMWQLWRE